MRPVQIRLSIKTRETTAIWDYLRTDSEVVKSPRIFPVYAIPTAILPNECLDALGGSWGLWRLRICHSLHVKAMYILFCCSCSNLREFVGLPNAINGYSRNFAHRSNHRDYCPYHWVSRVLDEAWYLSICLFVYYIFVCLFMYLFNYLCP